MKFYKLQKFRYTELGMLGRRQILKSDWMFNFEGQTDPFE